MKKKTKILNIIGIAFVLLLVYMIGFANGQASVYQKKSDDVSITDVYMSK